jgi:hypothetical protein
MLAMARMSIRPEPSVVVVVLGLVAPGDRRLGSGAAVLGLAQRLEVGQREQHGVLVPLAGHAAGHAPAPGTVAGTHRGEGSGADALS